jgi:hypothetical protein
VESNDLIVVVIPRRADWRVVHLDANRARPYSRAHDQRRDQFHRSPPPHLSGTGGRLRLRYLPLPPDPVRGVSFQSSAI